jgi:hypothetical protein
MNRFYASRVAMLRRSFSSARLASNPYASCVRTLDTVNGTKRFYALRELGQDATVARLPHCIRVLLESAMRNCDGVAVTEKVRPPQLCTH